MTERDQPSRSPEQGEDFDRVDTIWTEGFENIKRLKGRSGFITLATDVGRRDRQEDALVLNTDKDAFAVIDGIGGHLDGDRAARVLAETLQEGFRSGANIADVQRGVPDRMRAAGVATGSRRGGACYAAGIIRDRTLYVSRAGDVDIMVVSTVNGKVKLRTTAERGGSGGIANAVTSENPGRTVEQNQRLGNADRIYIASDGLWDNVTDEEITALTIGERGDIAIKKLFARATEQMKEYEGSPDNITILIYDILFPRKI